MFRALIFALSFLTLIACSHKNKQPVNIDDMKEIKLLPETNVENLRMIKILPEDQAKLGQCEAAAFSVATAELSNRYGAIKEQCLGFKRNEWTNRELETSPTTREVTGRVICFPSTHWRFTVTMDGRCKRHGKIDIEGL